MAIEQVSQHEWVVEPGFADAHTHPRAFDVLTRDDFVPENRGHEGKAGLQVYSEIALRSGITMMGAMGNETLRLYDPGSEEGTRTLPYAVFTLDKVLAMASRIEGESVVPTGIIAVVDPAAVLFGKDKSRLNKKLLYDILCQTDPYTIGNKVFLAESFGFFNFLERHGPAIAEVAYDVNPDKPTVYHVEGAGVGKLADGVNRLPKGKDFPLDFAHISSRPELEQALYAKAQGMNVQIEMTPHHGGLTAESGKVVKPDLKTNRDVAFLWKNIKKIDRFGSDCAPHRLSDKAAGTPGLANHSFMLPFLMAMAWQKRGGLTMEDVYQKLSVNPRRRFNIPDDDSNVTLDTSGELQDAHYYDERNRVDYEQNPLTSLPPEVHTSVRLLGRVVRAQVGRSYYDETKGESMQPSYTNLLATSTM